MDLYGTGASISQANSQTQQARELNIERAEFNKGLAEQLDQANLEQDENRKQTLAKNVTSGLTAGGKLALKKEIRQPIGRGIMTGGKFVKTSLAERLAKETPEELDELRPVASLEETQSVYSTGARPPSPELTRGGARNTLEEGEQLTAEATDEVGGTANVAGEAAEGVESSTKALAAKAAEEAVEKSGLKTLGEVASKAATVGKVGVAGLGGALDAGADVGRFLEGKRGIDVFGSNSATRAGNIMNIVGSGLEVAGVLGAAFPPALIFEALGAGISIAGAVTEGVGEEEAATDTKEQAEEDITSQARGEVVSSQVEQAVGRTQ
tara:strand:+ start:1105 stop:2076 length:972 start_codon:yes stop_codon:yes gene_type:complete